MSKIPRPSETLLGGIFKTIPGGKGDNQAIAIARLGAHVIMKGCVGTDYYIKEMLFSLFIEGINSNHILVLPEQSTGLALIQVDFQGQNSKAVASGVNFCLTSKVIESAFTAIGDFDTLVMLLETQLDTFITSARIASKKTLGIINPAPDQVLENDLLRMLDNLMLIENEISFKRGKKPGFYYGKSWCNMF